MECKSCNNYISIKMQYALLKNICPYCSGEIVRSKNLSRNLTEVITAVDKVRELVQQAPSSVDVVELVFDTLLDMFILYPREGSSDEKIVQQAHVDAKSDVRKPQFNLKTMSKIDSEEVANVEEEPTNAEVQERFEAELQDAYNELDKKTNDQVQGSSDLPDVENVEEVRQHIIQSVNQANMGAARDHTLEAELKKVQSSSSLRAKRTTDANLEISTGKNKTIQRLE